MSKRGLGLVLVLSFAVIASAAAAIQDFRLDDRSAHDIFANQAVIQNIDAAELSVVNLRAAQAAYVAPGQSESFWFKRATDLATDLEQRLNALQSDSAPPAARAHYDAAISTLGTLNGLDQKARDAVNNGDRSLASEVIFADASGLADRLSAELAAAQTEERAGAIVQATARRRERLAVNAAGIGVVLVVALALGVRRRTEPASDTPTAAEPPAIQPEPAAAVTVQAAQPAPRRVDLSDAAQVCVDLARVLDGQDVPPLLERAARVLDAKGLVLWVADEDGSMLRPSLAHGYSDTLLQRLGPLRVSAENMTSTAFRSLQPQTLQARGKGSADALAVPLIAPTGCVGVLAAELMSADAGAETLSVAKMFAAQLATIVAPAAAVSKSVAQA
jgi:hypothetical protein